MFHIDNSVCCLIDHHLAFVSQTTLNEVKHGAVGPGKVKSSEKHDDRKKRISGCKTCELTKRVRQHSIPCLVFALLTEEETHAFSIICNCNPKFSLIMLIKGK